MVVITIGVGFFYAFQPNSKALESLRYCMVKAKKAGQESQYDSLRFYAQKILTYHQEGQPVNEVEKWYYRFLQGIIYDENVEYNEQLAFIEKQKPETQNTFLGYYYAAKTELFSAYSEVDSCARYFDLAEPLLKARSDKPTLAQLYLSVAYVYLDKPQKGKQYWDKASSFIAQLDTTQDFDVVNSYYQIGSVLYNQFGEYEKAIHLNEQLLRNHYQRLGHLSLLSAYSDIAALYSALEDNVSAVDYYQKALELNKYEDVPTDEKVVTLYNLAFSQNKNGQFIEAIYNAKKALNIMVTDVSFESSFEDVINAYSALAYAFSKTGQLDSSFLYTQKAELLSLKNGNYNIEEVFHLYYIYYSKKDKPQEAFLYAHKALEASIAKNGSKHPIVTSRYVSLIGFFLRQNQLKDAWHYSHLAWQSIYADDIIPVDLTAVNFEKVLHKGRLLDILQLQIRTLEQSLENSENPLNAQIEQIYEHAKLSAKVLDYQTSSFKSEGSKMEKLSKEAQDIYEKAVRLGILLYQKSKKKEYLEEVFQYAERGKSMLLMDALQESHAANFAGIPDSLLEKERRLQRQIGRAEKKRLDALLHKDSAVMQEQEAIVFELRHQAKALEHYFEKEYPQYFSLKYASAVADLPAIQKQLDDKTTILEYVQGKTAIYLLTINHQAIDAFIIAHDSSQQEQMNTFFKSFMDNKLAVEKPLKSYNNFTQFAHQFYKALIPQLLASTERIVVIPDGQLSYLPFEILLASPAETASDESSVHYKELDYVLNKYKVNYNYTSNLWLQQQQQASKAINGQILAMAATYTNDSTTYAHRNPRERKTRSLLDPLPGAVKEVEKLAQNYQGKFFKANEANEADFKKSAHQYGILHLAMHGLVNHTDPEYSGLAFSENSESVQDNFLYAYEIKQLHLKAGLVVLSACETGLGKYQHGEGVISIGRGFMYAGTPSVLMTLWSLNDFSGEELVQSFYHNLYLGMDKDEAIRQAKITYLQQHNGVSAHPALWACFVQLGDYRPIPVEQKSGWGWWIGGGIALLVLGAVVVRRLR